ncbi:MAG: hypothetical protein ACLQBY_18225 [Solirubrobacteraceae bacterium]
MSVGNASGDVAGNRVAVDADDAIGVLVEHGRHVIVEVSTPDAAEHFDVGAFRDEYVDVANDRVRVDVDLGGGALGLRQVDRHVAKQRDSDQLILDVPVSRALAMPSALEDRLKTEQPSTAASNPFSLLVFTLHGRLPSSAYSID